MRDPSAKDWLISFYRLFLKRQAERLLCRVSALTGRVHCVSVFVERSLSLHESHFVACTVVAPLTYGCLLIHQGERKAASSYQPTYHIFCTLFNAVTLCPTDHPFWNSCLTFVSSFLCIWMTVHYCTPFKKNLCTLLNLKAPLGTKRYACFF